MSQQVGVLDITLKADADLSAKQYYLVKFTGAGAEGQCSLCAAITDKAIGILQNDPASGEAATIRVLGTSKLKIGATAMAIGDSVITSAVGTGKVHPYAGATAFVIGLLMETAAANDICEVLIGRFHQKG